MTEQKNIPVFRQEPVLVLVLGFVTCGLYMIYWNIKMSEVLNAVSGRNTISTVIAVLAGCCMPINVYFYYLCGQTLPDVGKLINKPDLKDQTTLLVILGLFVAPVAAMIVQGHVNEMYDKKAA